MKIDDDVFNGVNSWKIYLRLSYAKRYLSQGICDDYNFFSSH